MVAVEVVSVVSASVEAVDAPMIITLPPFDVVAVVEPAVEVELFPFTIEIVLFAFMIGTVLFPFMAEVVLFAIMVEVVVLASIPLIVASPSTTVILSLLVERSSREVVLVPGEAVMVIFLVSKGFVIALLSAPVVLVVMFPLIVVEVTVEVRGVSFVTNP